MCDSGGARRSWLRGIEKVQKRHLISALARNLGLVMRKVFGIGTPKSLQAEGGLASFVCLAGIHVRRFLRRRYSVMALARAAGTVRQRINRLARSAGKLTALVQCRVTGPDRPWRCWTGVTAK